MAQMGGPVISTFACGNVASPVLLPGTADCLIAMEKSEVLRPGFLEMLKPGGTVVLANTKIIPQGLPEEQYPTDEQIQACLSPYHVVEVDVLGKALELGDRSGRTANVVMMGILSTLHPFDAFPPELWLQALRKANPAVMGGQLCRFSGRARNGPDRSGCWVFGSPKALLKKWPTIFPFLAKFLPVFQATAAGWSGIRHPQRRFPPELTAALRRAEGELASWLTPETVITHPPIKCWRARSLGVKPSEFRPSVEALARRVLRTIPCPPSAGS